jgi:hypothetical protein
MSHLPPLDNSSSLEGPTEFTHWLVSDKILCGPKPQNEIDVETLQSSGITHVVNLTGQETPADQQFQSLMFPVPNFGVAKDEDVIELVNKMGNIIEGNENNKIYLHCGMGIGRTGTISGCLLSSLYHIDGNKALDQVQHCYNFRKSASGSCPETEDQREQVKRVSSHFQN